MEVHGGIWKYMGVCMSIWEYTGVYGGMWGAPGAPGAAGGDLMPPKLYHQGSMRMPIIQEAKQIVFACIIPITLPSYQ